MDSIETSTDSGDPDYNNDSLGPDSVLDTDGDGTPDFQDVDADADGVPDLIEGHDNNSNGVADTPPSGTDTDGDGLDDAFDPDNGGTPAPVQDTDVDGTPGFQDVDDDGDGIPTSEEDANGNGDWSDDDCDLDGTPDYLDADSCGPNLLRNDDITSLSSYDLTGIFIKGYPKAPSIPSLDQFGTDTLADLGEGALQTFPNSSNDDDFYDFNVTSPWTDGGDDVLLDNGRPLIFYELDEDVTIYVTKSGDSVQVTW